MEAHLEDYLTKQESHKWLLFHNPFNKDETENKKP